MIKQFIALPVSLWFILAGIFALLLGTFFGVMGSIQYVSSDFLTPVLPFFKSRPLHVSLVISWIFLAATGGIYYYLPHVFGKKKYSPSLAKIHFGIFLLTGIIILYCYFAGIFQGREYFEYPSFLAIPLAASWILFAFNFFKSVEGKFSGLPVYAWMWMTGILFFLFTFLESNLWQIPFFRDNIVRDISIQWKALGSMVGSWNMLVYGTSFFIMEKIKGDNSVTRSGISFFFYFLSLTNLMFNWGHHTYIIPASPVIKNVSYIISMTELLILFHILRNWKNTLSEAKKHFYILPYRLLFAADIWIFLNLTLAILISVPGINFYTHGTHITVAHAMGTTIGINTLLLLASVYYIFLRERMLEGDSVNKYFTAGFWLVNFSLLSFWISLIGAGITKAMEAGHPYAIHNFYGLMAKLAPYFRVFAFSGTGIFVGLVLLTWPVISALFSKRANYTKTQIPNRYY